MTADTHLRFNENIKTAADLLKLLQKQDEKDGVNLSKTELKYQSAGTNYDILRVRAEGDNILCFQSTTKED